MAEEDSIESLAAARKLLNSSLEKSRALALSLDKTGTRLDEIKERLHSFEAAFRCLSMQRCSFVAVRNQIDSVIGPAAAVLKVFSSVQELEKSLLSSESCSDLFNYLAVMKQLEEAMKFLADNSRLAIQWLVGIAEALEGNVAVTHRYNCSVKKSLRILNELEDYEASARMDGGLLFEGLNKLEGEFNMLVTEHTIPFALLASSSSPGKQACIGSSLMPAAVLQKLQGIIDRLKANGRLDSCISVYVQVRSLNIRKSLQELDLEYLEKSANEFDAQDIEGLTNNWCKHLELVVKHVLEPECKLCDDVFDKIGSAICKPCFAKIAIQSGILSFLQFGKNVTEIKKDPIKLLRLLDIFAALDRMRVDFNRVFGGEAYGEIRSQIRDLISRVVNCTCEIFSELPLQVKLQRQISPPSDGSVPRLVIFVSDYCNQLLGDNYWPILTQVLLIHQSWKQERYEEGLLASQIYNIIKEIALNLDEWSNCHQDITLSYIFMMNNHCHFFNLKGTKLGDMMGDSWLKAHEQYKNYYAGLYVRESWGKLFSLLRQDGLIASPGRKASNRELVKKKLKDFYQTFDYMVKKHSCWIVTDKNLREKICQLVVQDFLPVYISYLQNYGVLVEENANESKYVKYSANDLEKILSSLFQPNLRKSGNSRQLHFIGKIKNVVTHQFHLMLTAS